MKKHTHRAVAKLETTRCYSHCVNPEHCVPESHGNVCHVQKCRCGAERRVNANQGSAEKGEWVSK